MTTALALASDLPVAVLIVRVPPAEGFDHEIKQFKLSRDRVKAIADQMNNRAVDTIFLSYAVVKPGSDQSIANEPAAFYPKKWCYMEPISEEQQKKSAAAYERMRIEREAAEKKREIEKKEAEAIDRWISLHELEWEAVQKEAAESAKNTYGATVGTSKAFARAIVTSRARGIVWQRHLKSNHETTH